MTLGLPGAVIINEEQIPGKDDSAGVSNELRL